MADQKSLPGKGGLDLTVVTPRRVVTHEAVDSITARGALGELGVLPGHIPYLTMLQFGVMILDHGGKKDVFAHGPGYLEVAPDGKIECLVEQVAPASEIDPDEVKQELAQIEKDMKVHTDTETGEWKALQARWSWARARLDAYARRT